jgi:ATP-dependent Clp protease ATP-binding subunit ClpA
MSDKQNAFVRGIAAEFPGVPHRYCANHFLRDTAKPVLEADSRAKVQMRRKVRGLRAIEREVLAEQRTSEPPERASASSEAAACATGPADEALQDVVLDYCAAVRGILNDDQGGPLHPPGLRMAEALGDVQASLQRNLAAQKGGLRTSVWHV